MNLSSITVLWPPFDELGVEDLGDGVYTFVGESLGSPEMSVEEMSTPTFVDVRWPRRRSVKSQCGVKRRESGMPLTVTQRRVLERSTAKYTATIEDEDGNALASSSLTTLTLTLYDKATGTIINSRDGQNVLNANNVTVSVAGVLVWTMQPLDNVIVGSPSNHQPEVHVALFEWTWAAGAKAGKYEVQIDVEQLTKVPA